MTDIERKNGMKALKTIETGIREVEQSTNTQILACSSIIGSQDSDIVCFTGYNEVRYEIPFHIFMAVPQKRIIIEVARALTIEYNDYGQ